MKALGFSLKAKPSEVAFHFKRLLRVLEWDPRSYLGSEIMYRQWQESLAEEFRQNERRNARHERRMKKSEQQLLKLQRKLHKQAKDEITGRSSRRVSSDNLNSRRNSTTTNSGMVNQSPGSYNKSAVTTTTNSEIEKPNVIQSDSKFLTSSSEERSNIDVSPDRQHSKKAEGRGSRLLSRLRMHPSNGKDLEKLSLLSISSSSSSSSNNTKSHLLPNNMPSQSSKSDNNKEDAPEGDQAVNLYRDVVLGRVSPIVETEERQPTGDIS
jgi:Rad3-related DNA helicase